MSFLFFNKSNSHLERELKVALLFNTLCIITFTALLVGCPKSELDISNAETFSKLKPGIYDQKLPGIGEISGTCEGKIALTPYNSTSKISYPLVYDCQTQKFEILKVPGRLYSSKMAVGDLSFTENGYYLHTSDTIDLKRVGHYIIFDKNGSLIADINYPDLDAHDLILDNQSFTFIKYTQERNNSSCFNNEGVAVQLEISQKELNGKPLFDWSSSNQFNTEWKVSRAEEINFKKEEEWKKFLRPIRNCYTSLLLGLKNFQTPSFFIFEKNWSLFQLDQNDYIHANSIQKINSNGDLLVSARHLDTIFIINRTNGRVSWSLGGPYSKMSQNNPIGDPLKGFSHQHSAYFIGDTLLLFDNRNNFPKDASRIVSYSVDPSNPDKALFKYNFLEPNGKRRPAMGYVSQLQNNTFIVGWGAVLEEDKSSDQRAVSIVDMATNKEVFFINFLPNWISYRAKSSIELK